MIKAGIIGSTGYAGAELVRLLNGHPEAEIVWYGAKSHTGERYALLFRNLFEIVDEACLDENLEALSAQADVIFTATPQGYLSGVLTKEILSNAKVIDLSADYRFDDVGVYEAWYKLSHGSAALLPEAVYGLVELNRDKIKDARLIANPGCYTSCSILSCYPAVKEGIIDPDTLIINALSGVSGAGRGAKQENLFCEVNESAKPYGVAVHRHTPEIEEQLSKAAGRAIKVQFTPHLIPMNRGILTSSCATLTKPVSTKDVIALYQKYYGKERFIRVLPEDVYADTKWVEMSNYTDISVKVDERTNRLIVIGALDNLVKGAAGQAVQNMNLLFGLPEETGIDMLPVFP